MSTDSFNAASAPHVSLGSSEPGEPLLQKTVTISEEPEHIDPPTAYTDDTVNLVGSHSPRLHRASISGKKMTGRPPLQQTSSTASLSQHMSSFRFDQPDRSSSSPGQSGISTADLLTQVSEWLQGEKNKRSHLHQTDDGIQTTNAAADSAERDLALDKLERILADFSSLPTVSERPSRRPSAVNLRRGSILKKFRRPHSHHASSDTEWLDGDINVPHVEATLDNSKTMAFVGGEAGGEVDSSAKQKDQKQWDQFKKDIVRLTHTLKIRGWRRIPIEEASMIHVERLSGALTNAVYVVKPPKELPEVPADTDSTKQHVSRSKPLDLLLRVYGPQVGHLIDRETELNVLRRLARKKIGPRLLGYFTNGRFEEFLHAKTLNAEDLRVTETSKQIAKRMRELHDGIELLPSEREAGPRTFANWNKWVDQCEKVITWLDTQVKSPGKSRTPVASRYTRRGYICGVEWPVFRRAYEQYRKLIIEEYGGEEKLRERLIFAHNDTQYGNLMRLEPPGTSPLVQPANQHRQLIVIDFEYANANTPGYEFANHFAEWCYNYHDPDNAHAYNLKCYPTATEQYNFMRAYVMHRPQYAPAASATPKWEGREKTNIPDFMLDARTPGAGSSIDYDAEEKVREEQQESDIKYLLHETKLWRIANSAQWVAWGIVQAKVPELEEPHKRSRATALLEKLKDKMHPQSDPLDADVKALQDATKHDRPEGREQELSHAENTEAEEEEDFDYLGYSHERALVFWGDCLQMGIVKKDELPESLLANIKLVKL